MIHIICVYMLVRWNNALFNRTHNRTFPRNFEARRVTSYGCVQGAAEARRLPTRITATRARYVFSLRERPILLLFSITLSLSFSPSSPPLRIQFARNPTFGPRQSFATVRETTLHKVLKTLVIRFIILTNIKYCYVN